MALTPRELEVLRQLFRSRAAPVRRTRGRRVADNLRSVAQHGDAFVEKMTIQEEERNMAVHPQERARRSALRKTLTAQGYGPSHS